MENISNYLLDMDGISEVADSTIRALDSVRTKLLEPEPRKTAPQFTTADISKLTGLDRRRINELAASNPNYPDGVIPDTSNTRHFTLEEAIYFVKRTTKRPGRPEGVRGRIYTTTVFKGGTGKTTTSLCVAQALCLHYGRRGLLIDSDPQGSLTQMVGLQPEVEIGDDDTVMKYLYGDEKDLRYAVRPTYWSGLDVIPSNTGLYNADFFLPAQFIRDRNFQYWDCMRPGLLDLAQDYDFIIIDTPPSLNYLTVNFIYAADALIQPVPPQSVDFASASQFWRLLESLFHGFADKHPQVKDKAYDFLAVFASRVKGKEINTLITSWMAEAYGKHLLNISIPESSAIDNLSFLLQTIYDQTRAIASAEAHRKYKDRMDELVDFLDRRLMEAWGHDLSKLEF